MSEHDYTGPDRRPAPKRYSPQITLGSILSAAMCVGSVIAGYSSLTSRITAVEQNQINGRENMNRRDAQILDMQHTWQESIRDLHNDLARTEDKLDRLYELQTARAMGGKP